MIPPQTTAVPVSRSFFWLPVAGLRHVIEVVPIAITDARTGTAHLVTDSAAAWGRLAGGYVAVCGMQVLAASLTTPETAMCSLCARWPAPRRPSGHQRGGRHRAQVVLS